MVCGDCSGVVVDGVVMVNLNSNMALEGVVQEGVVNDV